MSLNELISQEELLAGMSAKQSKTLLFLIEKQTALLAARSRVDFTLTDSGESDRELAFLQAFAIDNSKMERPRIQQLERFARDWSVLVPDNPQRKAALLKALGEKYKFTELLIPNIRQVLGCEQIQFHQAFYRLYQKPLKDAFISEMSLVDKYHWLMFVIAKRIESLPSFWLATLVTIALGLPQAFLALPIATAELGSSVTVILLIVLGGINILTMICMAEAISRSQDFRSGKTFFKQLAANYLGKTGSMILVIAVSIRVFLIVLACYIGLSTTIATFTTLPATIWAGILFLLGLYVVSHQSFHLTLGVTILLAFLNVGVLLLFSLLCFNHWQLDNLDNLLYLDWNWLQGNSFKPQILKRVFGVTLMLYFGHVYVGECAKIVLPRDPSANSLIGGSIAGTTCLTFLFCLWVVAVDGTIAPNILASQTGTVLEPLIEEIGSQGQFLGTVLVTLLLGMSWLRSSSSLVNLSRKLLPDQRQSIVTLSHQQERLILQTRDRYDCCLIGITYLKFDDSKLTFRLDLQLQGTIYQQDIEVDKDWDIKELFAQYPQLNLQGVDLNLEIQSANRDRVCLKVISSMAMSERGNWDKNGLKSDFWGPKPQKTPKNPKKPQYLANQRPFLLSLIPLFLVFLLTEGLLLADKQSFTNVVGFAGVLGNSVIGGIFPVLLLISSRRKGELLPGRVVKLLNYPWLLGSIYCFSLLVIVAHGLFIWEHPLARISALSVTVLSLTATWVMLSTGAFISRTVIELEENQGTEGQSLLKITAGGKPKTAKIKLGYIEGEQNHQAAVVEISTLSSLRYAILELSTKQLEELRVWGHSNNHKIGSVNLPSMLEIYQENNKMRFDLKLFGDKVLLPLNSQKCWCKLEFPAARQTV
ncbi:aromatic amino acid transport family protein [Pleurocapsa sp. PCC 7319]|uniref:aromatic amino acid transport family protein n=1 Tax=Pleurocapsa sp. PCC 7319 TaxID=118161 RepID=UPI000349BB6F|nr:aromatic amino acid transport family protein [Pleurocapsa sp. PCC 7319]